MSHIDQLNKELLQKFYEKIVMDIMFNYFELKILDNETFKTFLESNLHTIFHKYKSRLPCCECLKESLAAANKKDALNEQQFHLLYEISSEPKHNHELRTKREITQCCLCIYSPKESVSLLALDIFILIQLITTCRKSYPGSPMWFHGIRDARNIIYHQTITEQKKKKLWNDLEVNSLHVASTIGEAYGKRQKMRMDEMKADNKDIERFTKSVVDGVNKLYKLVENSPKEFVVTKDNLLFRCTKHEIQTEDMALPGAVGGMDIDTTDIQDNKKCRVAWKFKDPGTWNMDMMVEKLRCVSCLSNNEIEFIYQESIVIITSTKAKYLKENCQHDEFEQFFKSFASVVGLDTFIHCTVDVTITCLMSSATATNNENQKHRKKSTSITVKWQKPESDVGIESYKVKYRPKSKFPIKKAYTIISTKDNEVILTQLKENIEYNIEVVLVDVTGKEYVVFRDVRSAVESGEYAEQTNESVKPKPEFVIEPTSTTLTVKWQFDSYQEKTCKSSYQIKHRVVKSGELQEFQCKEYKTNEKEMTREVEITNLKPNTHYEVKVFFVHDDGGNVEIFKDEATTFESKSAYLKETEMIRIDETQNPILYYMKPINIYELGESVGNDDRNLSLRICDIVDKYEQHWDSNREKTILVVGATGTGKSTLIDALINYIAEVSFTEDHRFVVINKPKGERERTEKEHESQTSSITVYRIPQLVGGRLDHKVNIIDTPGFNDTHTDFDNTIKKQMNHLFSKYLEHLDAVFVVVPMSTKRLTHWQQYVFCSILNIFGEDVERNVFPLFTYDDGGQIDGCMKVLKEAGIRFNSSTTPYFRFNNSNVLSPFHGDEENEARVWESRTSSFNMVFKTLAKTQRTTVKSSMDVMRMRSTLEAKLEGLKETIVCTVKEAVAIQETRRRIQLDKESMKKNKDYLIEQTLVKYNLKFAGKNSINCPKCEKTCHFNCWVYLDKFIGSCEVFENNRCTICQCDKTVHTRSTCKYVAEYDKQLIKIEDMLARYNEASSGLMKDQSKEDILRIQFERSLANVSNTLQEWTKTMEILSAKALFPPSPDQIKIKIKKLMEEMIPGSKEKQLLEKYFDQSEDLLSISLMACFL